MEAKNFVPLGTAIGPKAGGGPGQILSWIPAAIDEYFRLKNDTRHFIVPGRDYMIGHGLRFAELGDYENAILIFKAVVYEYPGSWEAHNALGEIYLKIGDKQAAIKSFKRALELNPENAAAREKLKELEK